MTAPWPQVSFLNSHLFEMNLATCTPGGSSEGVGRLRQLPDRSIKHTIHAASMDAIGPAPHGGGLQELPESYITRPDKPLCYITGPDKPLCYITGPDKPFACCFCCFLNSGLQKLMRRELLVLGHLPGGGCGSGGVCWRGRPGLRCTG